MIFVLEHVFLIDKLFYDLDISDYTKKKQLSFSFLHSYFASDLKNPFSQLVKKHSFKIHKIEEYDIENDIK